MDLNGNGTFNLHGGTLQVSGINQLVSDGSYVFDVAGEGKLIAAGDWTADFNAMIANGYITGTGVTATFDGGNTTLAIPEPGTLGLVTAFGGAILFVRRKFMI